MNQYNPEELIAKFLAKELNPMELEAFKTHFELNPDFREKVRKETDLQIALQLVRKKESSKGKHHKTT